MNKDFIGVIVDAGHGGADGGAVGNNLKEKDLNLQASQYMTKRLQELGIPVKMTRTGDEYLPKEQRIQRIKSLYNNPNTILISNHINAGGGEGAEIVYSLKNNSTLADLTLNNIEKRGQIKRKVYQRRLPENPNKDYYYILRETDSVEPLLIEYGFIDNTRDAQKLKNNLTDYVEGVVEALAEYLNYPYSPPGEIAQDYYIVQKGDTLYSLSKRFNISIEELKRINQLKDNILSIGQVLYLEEQSNKEEPIETENTIYTVVKGDSLWKIAKENKTTVKELIEKNNLQDLTLQIGQKLLVPKQNEIIQNTYIVQKGDTIFMRNNEY